MTAAYQAMQTAIKTGLQQIWNTQSARATQSGEEGQDPSVIIAQIADDMATVIAQAVETYVSAGTITPVGSNSAGTVVFTPSVYSLLFV